MHAGRNLIRSDVHHHVEITVISRQHRGGNQILIDVQSNGVLLRHIQISLNQYPKSLGTRIKQGRLTPTCAGENRYLNCPGILGGYSEKSPRPPLESKGTMSCCVSSISSEIGITIKPIIALLLKKSVAACQGSGEGIENFTTTFDHCQN
jgi:hypothetical protein